MSSRWPIVVGIAAIGGGVAWFALRSDPHEPATDAGSQRSADLTPPELRSRTRLAAPQPPSLAGDAGTGPHLAPAPTQTAEATFTGQARDADWAPATETEIRRRFQKVRGAKLQTAECREDRCQLVVAGSEADVSQTIADLESDRGLHGFASNVLLTAPERKPDGSLVLRAFAVFER
jgi:hypothetical protein